MLKQHLAFLCLFQLESGKPEKQKEADPLSYAKAENRIRFFFFIFFFLSLRQPCIAFDCLLPLNHFLLLSFCWRMRFFFKPSSIQRKRKSCPDQGALASRVQYPDAPAQLPKQCARAQECQDDLEALLHRECP